MAILSGKFDDHGYSKIEIAPEAKADPDGFVQIPLELTDGVTIHAREPAAAAITQRLVPAAAAVGRDVLILQGYAPRAAKMKQWRDLRTVARNVMGFKNQSLSTAQQLIVCTMADQWGCYMEVDANAHNVNTMKDRLLKEQRNDLEAYAKTEGISVEDAALRLLSFQATMFKDYLPLDPNSGMSVFNSGGHFDIEFVDKETGKPDFYGVPWNLLDTPELDAKLSSRTLFEDPKNIGLLQKAKGHWQLAPYLHEYGGIKDETFARAQENIRLLQEVAIEVGFVPWDGSVRTFSAPNTMGGNQEKTHPGHGDQSHAKKLGQQFAVWERVAELTEDMLK